MGNYAVLGLVPGSAAEGPADRVRADQEARFRERHGEGFNLTYQSLQNRCTWRNEPA